VVENNDMPLPTQKIYSPGARVPQDFRILSRCACLGNYVLRQLGWESSAQNHQKSRVDYLLDLAERPEVKPEVQIIEQHLLRKDILTFIEQQQHDFFQYQRPNVIFMDSFSELTDQLFVHRKEKWHFLANYSDIDHSSSFEQSFECWDLLKLDGLESLYRTFFSRLRTVYPDVPVVFLHFPTTLDRRKKFKERAAAIKQAVELISGEFENLYSLSIADNIVHEPEECTYEELKDFPYHYHQDVYKTFAQQILSLGIGHGGKPYKLNQVSYSKLKNEYKFMTADMDENGFVTKHVQTGESDLQLKQAQIDRLEWIGDTGVSDESGGWTFGIITNGKRDEWVNELIESIIVQKIPKYEIIVCGTYANSSKYLVRYIEFNENDDKGWLTKKKNIVIANAAYENVCIFHDRIRLAAGWYEGMKKFGDDWAVQYCGTFSPDGREEHSDAMVATAINGKYLGCNLDHNDWDPTMWIDGAQIIAIKTLLLKYNLDEDLFHCEGEDVEWCRRVQQAGFKIKFNPYSVLFNVCKKKVTENFDRNTMTAIAHPSRYTDIFKLCLISAADYGGCSSRTIREILHAEEKLQKLEQEKLADLVATRRAFYAEPLYVFWSGLSLEAQGQYRQASDEYKRAINLGLDHWRIKFYLARSEYAQGNIKVAEEIKNEIIRAHPRDDLISRLFAGLQQVCKTGPQQHTQLLSKRIRQISPAITDSNSQAETQWLQYKNNIREMILNGDLNNFLNWKVITATMFHEANIEELRFLQSLPDWSRWQKALRESPVGNPKRYKAYPESSGNLIHHAYTLAQLEQKSRCGIEQLPEIVEFGGGYGSMCRLAYQLGFKGRYIIYDLPEFTALQEYFLSCIGFGPYISYNDISDVPTGIVLLSDMSKLSEQLNYKATGRVFIAAWSISETPIEVRNNVFNLVSGADYYLIAYQDKFGEVDNSSYFSNLAGSKTDVVWTQYPIAHLPGNHYLIGQKKSLHIAEPDGDRSYIPGSVDLAEKTISGKGGNKPVKIYCVLFDTMPLLRSVVELAQRNGMELLRQVGGCFTTTLCAEMLTGKLPSDLEKNGIGYDRHQCYRNGDESDVHWPWEKELILNRLLEYGWRVKLHNGHFFSSILSNNPAFERTTSFPGGLEAEEKKTWGNETIAQVILGGDENSERFYLNEFQNIHQIQSERTQKNTFYFIKYDQFHVATLKGSPKSIAEDRVIQLLEQWDFNEPNAVFWFFSDHGDWRNMTEHPSPHHYLSWVMFKDNTADAIEARSKVVSAGDFFATVMNKFGYDYGHIPQIRSIQDSQDPSRIYFTEDGRQRFDPLNSTTAIACRFTDWHGDRPTRIKHVSYFKPTSEYKSIVSDIDQDGFVRNCVRTDEPDPDLKKALVDRFEWVSDGKVCKAMTKARQPIKIYCVLFDTMPLLSIIRRIAEKNNLSLLRQVGGCFTLITYVQMLTGRMPSDLEANGIGYRWHDRYKISDNIHWPWESEMVMSRVIDHGGHVRLHNNAYFTGLLSNNPAFSRSTSLPGGVTAEWKLWKEEAVGPIILGDGPDTAKFYEQEAQHIRLMQSEKPAEDTLYLVKCDQFHEAGEKSKKVIAGKRIFEWMQQWDFNEPNAVFWFFSDHGDWRNMGEHPIPNHYLSWVIFRDNTSNPIQVSSRFISAGDFFPTIMDKLGYTYKPMPYTCSIRQQQNQNRIFFTEDGRVRFDEKNSTTAIACRFADWHGDKPSKLYQASYFKPRNEYKFMTSDMDENGFITKCVLTDESDRQLKQALTDRFEWVDDVSVSDEKLLVNQAAGSSVGTVDNGDTLQQLKYQENKQQPQKTIVALIFSKDRAMQLQATVESFLLHCRDHDNVYLTVLYKATSELYAGQYAELKSKFPGVNFIEEDNFREQVLFVLESCDYILFLVDDNIFTRHFHIGEAITALDREKDAIGFSLRLGENTTYCYMTDTEQKQPLFEKVTGSILKYDWTAAEYDYNYPLEVSSSIYRSKEMADFLSDQDFLNPNTLETQMVSTEQFIQTRPKLLCYKTSVTFCNPVNKVQQVWPQNRSGGDENYNPERLAEIYQQGMVIDVNKYAGFVSEAVHREVELHFTKAADDAIKISVIIPCYNQARYLPEAIESLVKQTYKNWECIIVNDGSTDDTAEVAKQLIEKYPDRSILFIDKPHSGVSDTRNEAIKAAASEWILPLDSDDMFERTFMQRAVDIIQQEEKVDIVFANLQEFGAANGEWIPADYLRFKVLLEDTMPYSSLYRKELWRRVGGYDELLSAVRQPEDWSFWISCSRYNPVVRRIAEKLFLYRVHPQSTYVRMIKPNRELSSAFVATCHPDLYPVAGLVQAWQVIANCPDDFHEKISGAVEKCPEHGLAYFWRGLIQRRKGKVSEALEDYRIAAERAKQGDWQAPFALMMGQKSQGDLVGAHSSLEKLLGIRPDFDWVRDLVSPRVGRQRILFYYDRIGNPSETSPAGTVIAVLNFAQMLQNNTDMEIHITGDLINYPERYESLQIIPLPKFNKRAEFLASYDVVFFATHVRYFKDLPKPDGQIWILWQHCWRADDLVSLSYMSDFDVVICLSELHRASLNKDGIGDEKLMIMPNFIDTRIYLLKDAGRNNHSIIYAGALHEHKCVDVLIDAFRLVRRQITNAELHIYGDGSMRRGGDAYGDSLRSTKPEGTYFHGYVDSKDMPEIYPKHGILCLPSKFESFGLVTLEAQACGCIPVVHDGGGAAVTLADGQTGLLYSPNTPEKLAETIIAALKMADEDPSIRQRAVDFVRENFSTDRAGEYISEIWDRINIAGEGNTIRTLLEGNDVRQAELNCERLLQKYPGHPEVQLLQALVMNRQGNGVKAKEKIEELLKQFPSHVRALNESGLMAMKAGDTKNALSCFTRAYKFNPWDKKVIANCYAVLKASGSYRQAKTLLLSYLTNVGENAQMINLLGEIDALIMNADSAVNLVSQQQVNEKRDIFFKEGVSEPLISIIVPAYNSADYIGQAIESILNQNYKNFELLIIDDGSTDNTKEIVRHYNDSRIKYLYKENGGLSSARNFAVVRSRGQYIMPLDADDMMAPNFITLHLQEFDKHPEADLVYCDVLLINVNGEPLTVMRKPEYQDRRHLIRDLFRQGHPVVPFRLGLRKSIYDKIGLYDETLVVAEDYDMLRRFVKAGLKEHHLRETLHLRRMYPESLSRSANPEKARSYFEVIKRFTETFSYDELFPDVEWDKIDPEKRMLRFQCLCAATYLTLGEAYLRTNLLYAEMAFNLARSQINDCLKEDPGNRFLKQLLQKSELLQTKCAEAVPRIAP